jgi:hypothetical protein
MCVIGCMGDPAGAKKNRNSSYLSSGPARLPETRATTYRHLVDLRLHPLGLPESIPALLRPRLCPIFLNQRYLLRPLPLPTRNWTIHWSLLSSTRSFDIPPW